MENNDNELELITKVSCPVCFGPSVVVDTCRTMHPKSNLVLNIRECTKCKHWWTDPTVNQTCLSNFYSSSSEYVVPSEYPSQMLIPKNTFEEEENLYNEVCSYVPTFTQSNAFNYLELGIGSGHLFEYFRQRARIAYGIEPGRWVIEKDSFVVADIDAVPVDVRFDIAMAHDVLEHLDDPLAMVKKLSSMLNTGGILYCAFPNKDSWKAQLLKSKWSMIRPFGHVNYFSLRSLSIMFEDAGLRVLKAQPMRAGKTSALELMASFDTKSPNLIYRFFKSLLLGQLILGKDQWEVIVEKL